MRTYYAIPDFHSSTLYEGDMLRRFDGKTDSKSSGSFAKKSSPIGEMLPYGLKCAGRLASDKKGVNSELKPLFFPPPFDSSMRNLSHVQ